MEGGHAAHSQLEWPISPEDLPACLDAMKPLLVSTLDLGPNSDYTEKSLIRKMLIVLGEDRWGPQTLDPLPVQQILRWVPDVNKHLTPLRTMTGGASAASVRVQCALGGVVGVPRPEDGRNAGPSPFALAGDADAIAAARFDPGRVGGTP